MNATSQLAAPAQASATRRHPPRRTLTLATGLVLVALSVTALGAGAVAGFIRVSGTSVDLGAHGSYATDRYALVTDSTNWRTTLLGSVGTVRLRVASADGKPLFVGVAAPHAVHRYLAGTGYTTVAEHTGHGVVRTDHAGGAPATSPAQALRWTAQAQGTGTRTLRFAATSGRQAVFAANADGTRPVHVRVVSSAVTLERFPLSAIAGALAAGLVLLAPGGLLVRRTRRARKGVAA